MTSPNDATIHDLEQAVASLKLAQKPLDADDLLRDEIHTEVRRVETLVEELKRLRDNL